jgi:hypothetical protein
VDLEVVLWELGHLAQVDPQRLWEEVLVLPLPPLLLPPLPPHLAVVLVVLLHLMGASQAYPGVGTVDL